MAFALFGVYWVMLKMVVDLQFVGKKCLLITKMMLFGWLLPYCLMWCLWRERNDQCFEDSEWYLPDLKLFIFKTMLDWMSVVNAIELPNNWFLEGGVSL